MRYYVVSDTHGFYTETVNALRSVGFFEDTESHKLVLCGDALDRGSEALSLVDLLLKLNAEGRLIYVLGNHEELLYKCLRAIECGWTFEIASGMSVHYDNGTWDTILQLSGMSDREALAHPEALVAAVRDTDYYKILLPSAIDYYETEKYIFAHGWIPTIRRGVKPYIQYSYDPDWRSADREAWREARWDNGMDLACKHHITEPKKTVVCGHWHSYYGHETYENKKAKEVRDRDNSPFYAKGIISIDGCTVVSGRVNCIVIEDEEKTE